MLAPDQIAVMVKMMMCGRRDRYDDRAADRFSV
jgi:hypothetical protein